jgi:hypothetical protein
MADEAGFLPPRLGNTVALLMASGTAFGAAIGAFIDNMVLGIVIGIVLGAIVSYAVVVRERGGKA